MRDWLRRVAAIIGVALMLGAALAVGVLAALLLAAMDFWLRNQ